MKSIQPTDLNARIPGKVMPRATRRKANGQVTAALLIQMATEILTAAPTLRKKADISLMDLAAADKVRKELLKKASLIS